MNTCYAFLCLEDLSVKVFVRADIFRGSVHLVGFENHDKTTTKPIANVFRLRCDAPTMALLVLWFCTHLLYSNK